MDQKTYHMAHEIKDGGAVSALCFKKPRPINLKVACWTIRPEAVTCKKCLQLMPTENYKCRHCGRVIAYSLANLLHTRETFPKWIKSYCEKSDRYVHLMLQPAGE